MSNSFNPHHSYLPHIDGLRALAVIPVLLFHLKISLFQGGFTGVDIFFVISGYLITSGIFKDFNNKNFSLIHFYQKRIKRILPVYFFVVGVVLIVTVTFYSYISLKTIASTALSSAIFATNIRFSLNRDYFAANAQEDPLLNLWSLGVEEQFYIVTPLLLLLLWSKMQKRITLILLIIFFISLCSTQYMLITDNIRKAFYYPHLRAWEFIAGSLLAWNAITIKIKNISGKYITFILNLVGLLFIIIPFFSLNEDILFPGVAALPSVLGTLILINWGRENRILTNRIALFIGRISYSLYLWHWPVIVFWHYFTYNQISVYDIMGIIFSTIILSYLSWKWIETPFRNLNIKRSAFYYVFAIIGCTFLGGLAGLIVLTNGARNYIHQEANNLIKANGIPYKWKGANLWMEKNIESVSKYELISNFNDCLVPIGTNITNLPSFIVWGDSHAAAMLPGFEEIAKKRSINGLFINRQNGFSPERIKYCKEVLDWLILKPNIDYVFLVQRWNQRLKTKENRDFLYDVCYKLKNAGKKVVILSSVPEYPVNPNEYQARKQIIWFINSPVQPLVSIESYEKSTKEYKKLFIQLKSELDVQIIPIHKQLLVGKNYIAMLNNNSLYSDDNHVSILGAKYILEGVNEELFFNK